MIVYVDWMKHFPRQVCTLYSIIFTGGLYPASRALRIEPQVWPAVRMWPRWVEGTYPAGDPQGVENQGGCWETARSGQGQKKPCWCGHHSEESQYKVGRATGRASGARVADYPDPGPGCSHQPPCSAQQWPRWVPVAYCKKYVHAIDAPRKRLIFPCLKHTELFFKPL